MHCRDPRWGRATGRPGCRDCFSRLYERHRIRPARYLHESFGTDFGTALDIEAEAWKRAYQHVGTYRVSAPSGPGCCRSRATSRSTNSGTAVAPREVLFHRDALDLTAQVLARLNRDWEKAWTCGACKREVADEKCPVFGAKRP